MDASRRWRLAVLGTPKLTAPDGRAFRCEGRTLALLTYLSLEGPVPRARLATLLWPDRAESASRNNLVQLLRRMTGTYGEALVLATDTLTLAPQVQVDARDVLGGAVDVLDGVLLDHDRFEEMPDFSDWLEVQREQLDQRRAHLLVERAARLEAQGEYGQAVEVAWRALSFDPVSESVHRRVMRLLYLDGQPTQALRVYERLRDVLREALRTEPMPETRELARLIGRSEQLPLVVPARSPARVVPTTTVLTGREREWAALERAWQDGRFIIVRGEAGMGKSRLALDFAQSKGRVLTLEGRPGDHLAPYTTAARNVRRVLNLAKPDLPDWARRSLTWLLPDLAVSGEAPLERADARLHDAIRSVFQVGLAQVDVCLFDDIHYVDDATIEAGFVLIDAVFPLGRPGGLPHFVAVHRDDELSPFTRSVFEGMVSAGQAAWIELGALDEDAARALLMNLNVTVEGALASTLVQAAGGNPLFLLEGVQSLRDAPPGEGGAPPLPGKVGALITRRLSRLSNVAVHAARASAVLRRDFSPELVAAMLSAPLLEVVAAWEELEAAQIVRGERFVHDLIGEAIFTDIPSATRRLLQRAAARVLAESRRAARRDRAALGGRRAGHAGHPVAAARRPRGAGVPSPS
ncbi:BTAD domain-containing putative transcriptional regulator [Deinococcus pimensis]|uniref:BTAD domain-containing putative transcriptional regulator n=1 Tax=Deinococcus pimensis TaxID=309888 RepID=UPI0004890C42|nr:BTAD domain-containing putative transcriptional regulator [Deinococcus pimensis]